MLLNTVLWSHWQLVGLAEIRINYLNCRRAEATKFGQLSLRRPANENNLSRAHRSTTVASRQGCQSFIDTKYTKTGENILSNGHKMHPFAIIHIFQIAKEYNNLFHSKALQNLPKLGLHIFCFEISHLATLLPTKECITATRKVTAENPSLGSLFVSMDGITYMYIGITCK
jgi:hypothetical protein